MALFFSAATGGFFDDAINDVLPADVVEITPALHRQLLDNQCQGMVIVGDGQGNPLSVDPTTLLTLDELKIVRWQEAKQVRDQRIDGGCAVTAIGRFDTDMLSRSNINGAVTGAFMAKSAGAAFTVDWKLADNSVVVLDADQMIAVGTTVLAHVSACHAHSQTLGLIIQEAASAADLEALDITEGWPV